MSDEVKFCHPTCKRRWPCHQDDCPNSAAASSLPPASGTQLASSAAPESTPCVCRCQQPIPDGNGAAGLWGCVRVLGAFKTSCFASKKPPENKTTSLSDTEEEVRLKHMRCYLCSCFTKSYSYQLKAEAWASTQQQQQLPPKKTDATGGGQARVPATPAGGGQARAPVSPAGGVEARAPATPAGGVEARAPATPAGGFNFFNVETHTPGRHIIGQALLSLMAVLSGLGFGLTFLLIFVPTQ